ncbi:unnamed protein product [Owenia fusiformis]|uniref:Uncharacterized protein n=1 Tax=Owenia fusiformis TaxID=6347 RepID=A0A8J1Y2Y7_OWEFU|nr:unnamed protein product [Owenia fusiformis]
MDPCFFADNSHLSCPGSAKETNNITTKRVRTIIDYSKRRDDDIHDQLEKKLLENPTLTLRAHHSCILTYTSKEHCRRHSGKSDSGTLNATPSSPKRTRHSEKLFHFQFNCLFCGNLCKEDPKHPNRGSKIVYCRTGDRKEIGQASFKSNILRICHERGDELARQVRTRVEGAVSDLHAVEARYHLDCYKKFINKKNIDHLKSEKTDETDQALIMLADYVNQHQHEIWNSLELHNVYLEYGGNIKRKRMMLNLKTMLASTHVVLSCHNYASIMVHKSGANKLIKLVDDKDAAEETDDVYIGNIAAKIKNESKDRQPENGKYNIRMNKDIATRPVSPTLIKLLTRISKSLTYECLPAIMIGNMITSLVTNRYTPLLVDLGVKLKDRNMIDTMHQYHTCCSYDEMLRFKSSAAQSEESRIGKQGLFNQENGLVQVMTDNFDANICSQNGLKSTHAIAMLITQYGSSNEVENDDEDFDLTIPRLTKQASRSPELPDIE